MEHRIEYAVMGEDGELQVNVGTDRERAFRLTKRWNASALAEEMHWHYEVYERTIMTSDWEPTNTGAVQPMRGGIQE